MVKLVVVKRTFARVAIEGRSIDALTRKETMKIRFNATSISALLLSLCLVSLMPTSVRWLSNWRDPNIQVPGFKEINYYTPLGFYSLGLELIGLIVLWTGYQEKQRSSWLIMLIISLFFIFPLNGLNLFLMPGFGLSDLLRGVRAGLSIDIWLAVGALTVLVVLVALLLPIKAFWGISPNPKVTDGYQDSDKSDSTDTK